MFSVYWSKAAPLPAATAIIATLAFSVFAAGSDPPNQHLLAKPQKTE